EPDGVQHAGGRFADALGRVSRARFQAQALRADASELRHVEKVVVLEPVAEAPRRGEHGVLERDGSDSNREIGHGAPLSPSAPFFGAWSARDQSTRRASTQGPSM